MSIDFYQGNDPRDLPAYTPTQAATYLRLSDGAIRTWTRGYWSTTKSGRNKIPPVIDLPGDGTALSFTNLVELHVLRAIRHVHSVPLQRVREALAFVGHRLGVPHPLATRDFETDGVDLFVEELGSLITASRSAKQVVLREAFVVHLHRIERDEAGLAARLFPFTRDGDARSPSLIVIDPGIAFGRPVIAGTGVPVDVVVERFRAGESVSALARDYRVEDLAIEEAVRSDVRWAA